jgi:hypothetical protein
MACARTAIGLFLGIAAASGVVLYLGISQKHVVASLHDVLPQPLIFAAFGALVLLGLQSLRWWEAATGARHLRNDAVIGAVERLRHLASLSRKQAA